MRLNRLWGILVIILVASLVAGVVSSVYEQNTDTIVIAVSYTHLTLPTN